MNGVEIKNVQKKTHKSYLDEYLKQILSICDKIRLFSSSSYSSEAPMGNLYVSMPTNVYIDIEVNSNQVINIWETISTDEDINNNIPVENTYIKYEDAIKYKVVNKLTELINQGKEYLYPNIEERPLTVIPVS